MQVRSTAVAVDERAENKVCKEAVVDDRPDSCAGRIRRGEYYQSVAEVKTDRN